MTADSLLQLKKMVRRLKVLDAMLLTDGDEIPEEISIEVHDMKSEVIRDMEALLSRIERKELK